MENEKTEIISAKYITEQTNHMEYQPGMDNIGSEVQDEVISRMNAYDADAYTAADVLRALRKDVLSPEDFGALLSPAALPFLEQMAQRAQAETRKHFGNSVQMFTPLYIANYCENYCIYCGFNCHNKIRRAKLDMDEIEQELKAIAESGLQEILILTGESRAMSPVSYIGEAVKLARKYFRVIGIEIYPLNVDEYAYLHECGVDYVTVFQETYDDQKYKTLHLGGHKRIFPYRLNAQERALMGGMRGVGFAALLGLSDFRKDAFATGLHAYLLQRKYPHAEIAFSCPRLRPIINNDKINPKDVHEPQLLQVVCAYRIFMPFASITISTRERAGFRDNIIGIAATKISAGVDVGIGGHSGEDKGDEQFEISDGRSVDEVYNAICEHGLQPVMADYLVRLSTQGCPLLGQAVRSAQRSDCMRFSPSVYLTSTARAATARPVRCADERVIRQSPGTFSVQGATVSPRRGGLSGRTSAPFIASDLAPALKCGDGASRISSALACHQSVPFSLPALRKQYNIVYSEGVSVSHEKLCNADGCRKARYRHAGDRNGRQKGEPSGRVHHGTSRKGYDCDSGEHQSQKPVRRGGRRRHPRKDQCQSRHFG